MRIEKRGIKRMNYRHMMIVVMSALCFVSNMSASQENKSHRVNINIEDAYEYDPLSLTKSIELSPDDYKSMQENPKTWALTYFGIPDEYVDKITSDNDSLNLTTVNEINAHYKYFDKWNDIINKKYFLDAWKTDVSQADFSLQCALSVPWADFMDRFINVPFVQACIREYIKEHKDTFGSVDNLKRMKENNARVQASDDVDKKVKKVWKVCVDQVCICKHDEVCEILSGVTKFIPSPTDDDIWLCSYVCEREAGKKMLESWMNQLTAQELSKIERFAANIKQKESGKKFGYLLEDIIAEMPQDDLPKPPSFLNATLIKRLGIAAGVCGVCALAGYFWYKHSTSRENAQQNSTTAKPRELSHS